MGGVPTLDEEDVEEQEVIVDVVSRGATNDRIFPSMDDPTDVMEWSLIISCVNPRSCVNPANDVKLGKRYKLVPASNAIAR
jgi:hypothetical protein